MKSLISAEFKRLAPTDKKNLIDIPIGWFSISSAWFQNVKDRRINTGKLFRIAADTTQIYRIIRFSPKLDKQDCEIIIDWDSWLKLINYDQRYRDAFSLKITKASWYHYSFYLAKHPDVSIRVSFILGILSCILGTISLIK